VYCVSQRSFTSNVGHEDACHFHLVITVGYAAICWQAMHSFFIHYSFRNVNFYTVYSENI